MKKIGMTLLLIITAICNSQSFKWANKIGGVYAEQGLAVTMDAFGDIVSTGSFGEVVDFDPGPGTYTLGTPGDAYEVFVTKTDSLGNFIWARAIGGPGISLGNSIATDAAGNVYVTGYFDGALDCDPGPATFNLFTSGNTDIFILKLDVNGNFSWAVRLGASTIDDGGQGITVDPSNNVLVTGYFGGSSDFDPGPGVFNLTAAGPNFVPDVFILKLSSNGNFIWVRRIGDTAIDRGYAITTDASGNVYTTGSFCNSVDFDPGPGSFSLTGNGLDDAFVSKLNSSGNFVWARAISGSNEQIGCGIALDGNGDVISTGRYDGTIDLDPGVGTTTVSSAGLIDIYVSKLSPTGAFIWGKSIGGVGYDYGMAVGSDTWGNVHIMCSFENAPDFDPGSGVYSLASAGSNDIAITKLDAGGNFLKAFHIGGTGIDAGFSLFVEPSGAVYSTGYFQNSVDFDITSGTYTLTSAGASMDIYVHKMFDCTPPLPLISTTSASALNFCSGNSTTLYVSSVTGTIQWYTSSTSTLAIGSGTSLTTPTLAAGIYTYYVGATTCTEGARSAITVTVNTCTGLSESVLDQNTLFVVYPNPVEESLIIELYSDAEVQIVNIMGHVVFMSKLQKGKNEIDVSTLSKGIYFITFTDNNGYRTKKLIKR